MSISSMGGRGKKAPYETVTIRVPKSLAPLFLGISERVKERYDEGEISGDDPLSLSEAMPYVPYKMDWEILDGARAILKRKKSARASLQLLLEYLYPNWRKFNL